MQYRKDKYGNEISILGFGCMRFSRKMGATDMKAAERQVMTAIENGVNYFDTAYIYPGNEAVLGEILEKNQIREKVNVATKLPHYLARNLETIDKMFNEQLKRLRTDYIDYYLIHMLSDVDAWERLKSLGIEEWIQSKMESGQIRQIGFSYHGNTDMFCQLIDIYDWDFTMIQYNYMDEHSQAGRRGLQYASEKGLPVFIMEPLRGGKLVNGLPEEAKKIFADHPAGYSPAGWAFRWLWNQPEVTCVLSGMNSDEMVLDNIETACDAGVGSFGDAENEMLHAAGRAIYSKMKVGCTGCGYCIPCPTKVDIPGTFAAYNRSHADSKFWGIIDYVKCTALRKTGTGASNCIGCGKCEKHCPQGIEIRHELKNASRELEGPIYKLAHKIFSKFV